MKQGAVLGEEALELEPGKTASCELALTLTREERVHRAEVLLEASYADGYREKHRLSADAAVYEDFSFEPGHLDVEVSKDTGGALSRELVVHRRFRGEAGREGHLIPSVGPAWVSTAALELVSDATEIDTGIFEQTFRLTVTANPSEALRARSVASAQICISAVSTADQEQPRGCISLVLTKREGLIAPQDVLFGPVEVGTTQRRRVLIRSADRKSFRLLGGNSSHDDIGVNCSVADAVPGSQAWAAIVCRPTQPGSISGRVTVETDYASDALVTLHVKATGVTLPADGDAHQARAPEGTAE